MCICISFKLGCFSCNFTYKNEGSGNGAQKKQEEEKADCLDLVLAIFVPPVAIYKKEKRCTAKLWANIFLTASGYVLGSIHALISITT
ncbi:hypothetical protein GQ457_08G022000 [Hibiscus cannabinus]